MTSSLVAADLDAGRLVRLEVADSPGEFGIAYPAGRWPIDRRRNDEGPIKR